MDCPKIKGKNRKSECHCQSRLFCYGNTISALPLAKTGSIQEAIHINATTGSTGAGVGLSPTGHFSWRNNNISWYKPFTHQHLGEIGETLWQSKKSIFSHKEEILQGEFYQLLYLF